MLQPHEERVVIEKKELDDKLSKLKTFLETSTTFKFMVGDDATLLMEQYASMQRYSEILGKRIVRFNDKTSS